MVKPGLRARIDQMVHNLGNTNTTVKNIVPGGAVGTRSTAVKPREDVQCEEVKTSEVSFPELWC